jgi:hypothetical protein
MLKYFQLVTACCVIASALTMQTSSRTVNAMDHNTSIETEAKQAESQEGSSQSGSGTVQANIAGTLDSYLSKYPDRSLRSTPTQPVSPRFVVEHRSALNGKTITLRGVVVQAIFPGTGNATSGEQSMANPQPRVFVADNLRKRRDKNYDVMVLLREGECNSDVGQSLEIKVKVDATKSVIVLRKLY